MIYRLFLLLLVSTVTGCSRNLEETELPGIYQFIGSNFKQEITIQENGSYLNAFYRDGVLVWFDQSNWEYKKHAGDFEITFTDFRFGIPGHSNLLGYWFVVPEKNLRSIKRLCFDPDLDQCFEAR